MKLFKNSREPAENRSVIHPAPAEERFKSIEAPISSFGNRTMDASIGGFGVSKTMITSTFPLSIDSMREEVLLHQGGYYQLMIVLKALSGLGDQDDFLLIMKQWGSTLAKEVSSSFELFRSEQRFDVLITYLNQHLIHKHMGAFQCTVNEAEKSLVISYYFTPFDRLLLSHFTESSCVTLYGTFFKNLMGEVAEAIFEIQSIEASDELWQFKLKA